MTQFHTKPLDTLTVTSKYGNRQYKDKSGKIVKDFHKGIDYAARTNTPVYAMCDGRIFIGRNDSAGNYIIIYPSVKCEIKEIHFYHLNMAKIPQSALVVEGQTIALSGSTGNSTGPHLHIGMKDWNGNYIDPTPYMNNIAEPLPPGVKLKKAKVFGKIIDGIRMYMINGNNYVAFKDLEKMGLGTVGYDAVTQIPELWK